MARRASSSINTTWIVATIAIVIVAVVIGRFLLTRVKDPYRTIPNMEVHAYLENANSLRGNVYKVTGVILNSLAWSPTKGRLFSLEVSSLSGVEILPVLIPADFNHINIQKGQSFAMQIEVGDAGILRALDLKKS